MFFGCFFQPACKRQIGISDWQRQISCRPPKNPVNDARDIAKLLEKSDFNVSLLLDASYHDMENAVQSFGKHLKRNGGVGLFYFAGHGLQVNGRNYLIPVDTNLTTESDIESKTLEVGSVLNKMEASGTRVNIIILDASRKNPYDHIFKSSSKGLAEMDTPIGSIIALAASPGSISCDGEDRNSIYTKHLLLNLKKTRATH